MKIIRKIKNSSPIRGFYFFFIHYFRFRRSTFGYIAKGARITPPSKLINPQNIYIYSDCAFGENLIISALNAKFILKRGCTIAEGLNVRTGNHARIVGKFVGEITEEEKPQGYDSDIIVEEDVWIGSNVTLLAGVTIGRGTTIAAGAVVTKSMPPYCICGGIPAHVIKLYWTIDQILEHEKSLYPEEERFSREYLEELFAKYYEGKKVFGVQTELTEVDKEHLEWAKKKRRFIDTLNVKY